MRASFARMFRHEPYVALVAESGAAALAVLRSRPIDVIVSDDHMYGMRGTELLTHVRQERPRVTRILLTGAVDGPSLLGSAPDRVLAKPIRSADLKAAIAEALASRSAP